jgi:hypothetical protein
MAKIDPSTPGSIVSCNEQRAERPATNAPRQSSMVRGVALDHRCCYIKFLFKIH